MSSKSNCTVMEGLEEKPCKRLDFEVTRFLEKTLWVGKRNGFLLEGPVLKKFKNIKNRLSELKKAYLECLNEHSAYFMVNVDGIRIMASTVCVLAAMNSRCIVGCGAS